jgi:hypothetical protein
MMNLRKIATLCVASSLQVTDNCRTIALWFYILVFDHNAADHVTQKTCDVCTLRRYISPCSSKSHLITYLSFSSFRHTLVPIYIFHLFLNSLYSSPQTCFKFLRVDQNGCRMAANSKSASLSICTVD